MPANRVVQRVSLSLSPLPSPLSPFLSFVPIFFPFGTPFAIVEARWLSRGEPGLGPAEGGVAGAVAEKRTESGVELRKKQRLACECNRRNVVIRNRLHTRGNGEQEAPPDGSEAPASDNTWRADSWSPEPLSARLFYFATAKLNTSRRIEHGEVVGKLCVAGLLGADKNKRPHLRTKRCLSLDERGDAASRAKRRADRPLS